MIEMTFSELQQVSGGGGRGGLGGDIPYPHPNGSASQAASLLGRKPGVSPGVAAIDGSPTTLGGRGGLGGEI